MRRFFNRVLHLLRVRRPDAELARELELTHLALLQDSYEARGLSPDAADVRRGWPSAVSLRSRSSIATPGGLPLARRRDAGRRPRRSPVAAEPGVHRDGGAVIGDRHRRQHRHLHGGQRWPALTVRRPASPSRPSWSSSARHGVTAG